MSEASFNMNIVTNEDLHDVPEDKEEMIKGFAALLEKGQAEVDELKKAALLAKAGLVARYLSELDNSVNLLTEAMTLLKENGQKAKAFDLKIRLSITQVYQGKYPEAEKVFNDIVEKANSKQPRDTTLDKLKEIALIGLAKSKIEQKKYQGAIRCFTEAGDMKADRGDTLGFNRCKESQKALQEIINKATGTVSIEESPDNYIDPLLAGSAEEDE